MPNYVPGKGNPNAKILIVGEAPGAEEDRQCEPFVGPAGNLLNEVLRYAEIERADCYITNVVKYRPPNNDLKKLNLIGYSVESFLPQLDEEIRAINPNVVFALGATALSVLTGMNGITTYRGSIYPSIRTGHKTIASIHPAAILHGDEGSSGNYKDLFLLKRDAVRVKEQSLFPEIRRPDRSIVCVNNSNQVATWIERNKNNPPNSIIDKSRFIRRRRAVVDIETWKTFPLLFGMACNSWDAISIPLFSNQIPPSDLAYIWYMILEFLSESDIIGQNLKYDVKRSRAVGISFEVWFDLMQAWHTIGFAELRKDLATLCSLLTEEPYYKSEGKEYNPLKDKIEVWMRYNGKDCYTEWECYERLHEMLIETGTEDFFFDRGDGTGVSPLNAFYDRIEDIGILVDEARRKVISDAYRAKREEKENALIELLRLLLEEDDISPYDKRNKKEGLVLINSYKMLPELLYGKLKIPVRKDTGEDTIKSLMNNAVKHPGKKRVLELILELRKIAKLETNYINFELSEYATWL